MGHTDSYLSSRHGGGELNRIGEQVHQDLSEPQFACQDQPVTLTTATYQLLLISPLVISHVHEEMV